MERRIVWFEGMVQGVGFRYTAQRVAEAYSVCGYVRNLSNGEVELAVEGERDVIDAFVGQLTDRMRGYISNSRYKTAPATGEFNSGLAIRR